MKAIEILYNLSPYQRLLEEIYQKESKEDPNLVWKKSLSSQYSFITLELKAAAKEDLDAYEELMIQITFEIDNTKVILNDVYCEEKSKKEELEQWIKSNKALHDTPWHTEPNNTWYHDEKVTAYINMADEIAKETYNCASGDDYRPGCFSQIKIEDTFLSLSQINLHHAKSSAHKEDYHMRKLHFYIPTTEKAIEPSLDMNYQIGEMYISFSDHSSPKNRACGQKIVEEILHQKASFEKHK
jgi:hypothetical protein